jgi:hypothetical protein
MMRIENLRRDAIALPRKADGDGGGCYVCAAFRRSLACAFERLLQTRTDTESRSSTFPTSASRTFERPRAERRLDPRPNRVKVDSDCGEGICVEYRVRLRALTDDSSHVLADACHVEAEVAQPLARLVVSLDQCKEHMLGADEVVPVRDGLDLGFGE